MVHNNQGRNAKVRKVQGRTVKARVDTKFRDTKFRIKTYFRISRNFHFISRDFGEISQQASAKFRAIELKISQNLVK
jgi:hypothetical protein